jgi:hypothetical protein
MWTEPGIMQVKISSCGKYTRRAAPQSVETNQLIHERHTLKQKGLLIIRISLVYYQNMHWDMNNACDEQSSTKYSSSAE